MGRFKCLNEVCPKAGWASKMIAITIRMYPEQQYNARVYHQTLQKVVEVLVSHSRMIHTQRELHIVSKSGMV